MIEENNFFVIIYRSFNYFKFLLATNVVFTCIQHVDACLKSVTEIEYAHAQNNPKNATKITQLIQLC